MRPRSPVAHSLLTLSLITLLSTPPPALAQNPAPRPRVIREIPKSIIIKEHLRSLLPSKEWRQIPLRKRIARVAGMTVLGLSLIGSQSLGLVRPVMAQTIEDPPAVELALKQVPKPELPASLTQETMQHKVRSALLSLAQKQFYKEHQFKVYEVNLGEHAAIGFQVKAKPIADNDPLVTQDATRAAVTARQQAAGNPVSWAVLGGGLFPKAGISFSFGKAWVSFAADGMVGYSVLAPYAHNLQAVGDAARNLTVDLPLTGEKALALEEGTEVLLHGQAKITAATGGGVGETIATIGSAATIGAQVGAHASASRMANVQLRIKRLAGDKVFVSVTEISADSLQAGVRAHVGVDSHIGQSIGVKGDGLYAKAVDLVAGKVDQTLEKYLQAGISADTTHSRTGTEITSYTFDLSRKDVTRAYEQAFRLDTRQADTLHAQGSGVGRAHLEEQARTSTDSLKAHVGPFDILNAASGSTERHGTLTSAGGTIQYDRTKLSDRFSMIIVNFFAGKRSVDRELVSVRYPGQEAQSYLHIRSVVKGDHVTSKNDTRRFLALAEYFGAQSANPDQVLRATSMGKTDRVVDVYVSDAGLQQLMNASPAQLQQAHAAAYERIDQPWKMNYLWGNEKVWKVTPWLNTAHPEHAEVMRLLAQGPDTHPSGDSGQQSRADTYRYITGRNLSQDAAAYQESQQLVQLVQKLRDAGSPAARARVFAEAEKQLGLDFARELGMVSQVVGGTHFLVNEVGIRGQGGREIRFVHEGRIQDPQVAIDSILNNPR